MGRDERGASSVLAVVLMMGFVAAASVSLFVVGTATVAHTQDTAEEQQVENTFKEFDKDVASVAYGRQKYRTMQFDIHSDTAAFRKHDTGNIKIIVDGTVEADKNVGSLVYEKEGTNIAYQAGGVWRGTGKNSRMVSKPPVEYQNGSLTFPIPVLDGSEELRSGNLDIKKTDTNSPINDDSYIQGQLVTLKIKSEYYMGWAEYFRTQTNDVAVSVDHSPAGDTGIVTVKLGQPVANGDFQEGVMATGGDDGDVVLGGGSPEIDGPVAATGDISYSHPAEITGSESPNQDSDMYELDDAIDRKVEDAKTNESIHDVDLENGATTLDNGNTYFDDDGFSLSDSGDTVDVDLSSGNVTLIVDGDMELTDADINVRNGGGNKAFRIYTTGDLGMKNTFAGDFTDKSDEDASTAQYLQIYGTSEMLVGLQGGSTRFVGTIYAPRNEPALGPSDSNAALPSPDSDCDGYDVCIVQGSSSVKGAIVAGPTKFEQGAGMEYDSSIENMEPTLQLEDGVLPPPITFLKVSVHTVEVENSDNVMPAASVEAAATDLDATARLRPFDDSVEYATPLGTTSTATVQAATARRGAELSI